MSKYLEHFVRSKCAPDLLVWKMFPNCKEITESWGCFEATKHTRKFSSDFWNNPNRLVIVVGDGKRPRTGATFAMRTAWTVISVDPAIDRPYPQIKRLHTISSKVEEWTPEPIWCEQTRSSNTPVLVVAPHSHASLRQSLQKAQSFSDEVEVISLPCCVQDDLSNGQLFFYTDHHITSAKNRVNVYKFPRSQEGHP